MDVIKNDKGTNIDTNMRRTKLEPRISQTNPIRILQPMGVGTTRRVLVKIEKGTRHVRVSQLKVIKIALGTPYEELLE